MQAIFRTESTRVLAFVLLIIQASADGTAQSSWSTVDGEAVEDAPSVSAGAKQLLAQPTPREQLSEVPTNQLLGQLESLNEEVRILRSKIPSRAAADSAAKTSNVLNAFSPTDNKPPGGRWSKVLETLGIGQDKPKESEEWGGVELSTSMYQRPVGPAQQAEEATTLTKPKIPYCMVRRSQAMSKASPD
ncbi:hypothetical protein CYMTET_30304, partial [Cymbomonas tetramitiformis]